MVSDSSATTELGNEIELETLLAQPPKLAVDVGTQTSPNGNEETPELPGHVAPIFRFEGRHIQMMGLGKPDFVPFVLNLGAAIGSGLLFGTGEALYFGGPVSLWLAYLLTGTVMYAVMV